MINPRNKKILLLWGVITLTPLITQAAPEDYTTYTKVDPNSHLTVTASKIDWIGQMADETNYVYKDYGAGNFGVDFEQKFDAKATSAGTFATYDVFWMVSNNLNDMKTLDTNNQSYLGAKFYIDNNSSTYQVILAERDGTNAYTTNYTISLGTIYYFTVIRDSSVGSFGTLYLKIYSDSGRTTLLNTLTLTLHSNTTFQYIFGETSYNTGDARDSTGFVENLEFITQGPPPSNEATSSVDQTHQDLSTGFILYVIGFIIPMWFFRKQKT